MGDGITPLYLVITLFPLIFSFLCTPFCLTAFIIGVTNIGSCPIQPLIPIWIIITGCILFTPTMTSLACVSHFYTHVLKLLN
jgi:hypothetical protein